MNHAILDVLSHHMTCVSRSDVDGIMEAYTDSSILFSPDGPLQGKEAIRQFFVTLTTEMMPAGTNFVAVRQDVIDETAFMIWQAESASMKFHLGAETMVIRDGKIVTHSFAAAVQRKS